MDERVKDLWKMARYDKAFQELEESFSSLEKLFEITVAELSDRKQDIIWAFVLKSTELDQYLIRLALERPDSVQDKSVTHIASRT